MTNHQKPLLTISLLASNRPDTIRRCLDSLHLIMDKIPCELILVDTSKSESIHEILLEYSDQVYEFEWCKDFAKARNVGLEKAKGEWFLFLDDDEWFVDVEELLQFFQSGEYKKFGYANYRIRNFFDTHYVNYSDGWVTRMIKLEADTAFVGKVHEMFAPLRGLCKDINAVANHSGYIYLNEEQKRAHFERNATLLQEMIEKEPWSMRWRLQLMQEYDSVSEYQKQADCCKSALDILIERKDAFSNLQRTSFQVGYVSALINLEEIDTAIQSCMEFLVEERTHEAIKAIFDLQLAKCYLMKKNWKQSIKYSKKYLCQYEKWHDKFETVVKKNTVPYLGECYAERKLGQAYGVLIASDLYQGRIDALKTYYDKLSWSLPTVYSDVGVEQALLQMLAELPDEQIVLQVLTDIYRNRGLRDSANVVFEEATNSAFKFEKVMRALSEVDADEGTVWYARACVADWENRVDAVNDAITEYFYTAKNVFCIPEKLCELAEKYNIDIYAYWKNTEPRRWRENVDEYVKFYDSTKVLEKLKNVFSKEEWRYQYFLVASGKADAKAFYRKYYQKDDCENMFLFHPEISATIQKVVEYDAEDLGVLCELLYDFMCKTIEYYLTIFKDEAFEGEMEMLPAETVAAVWLNQYFAKEENDWEGRIAMLRECARCYPAFGEIIKLLANGILVEKKAYEATARKRAEDEMAKMLPLMKEQINIMIAQGLKKEALVILEQVLTIVPEDEELILLAKNLD